MTPIDPALIEKWTKEAEQRFPLRLEDTFSAQIFNSTQYKHRDGYMIACEAMHREYSERIETLEGLLRECGNLKYLLVNFPNSLHDRITATLSEKGETKTTEI